MRVAFETALFYRTMRQPLCACAGRKAVLYRCFDTAKFNKEGSRLKVSYKMTTLACYTGYVMGATVNCLPPLLYSAYHTRLGISLPLIGFLITLNFMVQIFVDLGSATVVRRIGYRPFAILGELFGVLGLLSLGLLPSILPSPYLGLVIGTVLAAIGSGLNEVIISPIVEAIPSEHKTGSMALLHSFYCWGHVAVVLLSTLYFRLMPDSLTMQLPILWALIPTFGLVLFTFVPICTMDEAGEGGMSAKSLLRLPLFYLFCILMLAGGAAELSIGQWSSFFAEEALGVSKTVGDLLGPCLFAVLMGLGRVFFGIFGDRLDLRLALAASSLLAILCYLTAALSPLPVVALIGCAASGLAVAIMWPGVLSLGAQLIPRGGTVMFVLFALGGDLGCTAGPGLVSLIANDSAGGIRRGLLCSLIFPVVMFSVSLGLFLYARAKRARERSL